MDSRNSVKPEKAGFSLIKLLVMNNLYPPGITNLIGNSSDGYT